jgi:hypothetical protein
MKEARFLYKCRQCGVIEDTLCCGVDNAMLELTRAMAGHNNGPASWNHGFPIRMTSIHHCDYSIPINTVGEKVGISDLIGYKIVETE